MWVLFLFAATSLSYAAFVTFPKTAWMLDWLMMNASVYLMYRLACLVFPHHRRGPILAVAFVALIPRFSWMPFQGSPNAAAVPLAAAAALLGSKIYLRDGLKPASLLLLGLVLGLGMAASPAFFQVLPWALLPVLASGRGWRQTVRGLALMAAAFLVAYTAFAWWLPSEVREFVVRTRNALHPALIPGSPTPHTVVELLRALGSPTSFVSPAADLVYVLLSILMVMGFLQGVQTRDRAPVAAVRQGTSQNPGEWRKAWRLTPLFATMILVGMLSALGWGAWDLLVRRELPRVDDFYLAKPCIALLAAIGFANLTDWIRRRHFVGNWIAEHLVAYGLALHLLANILCLIALRSSP